MDKIYFNTTEDIRKPSRHLSLEERGMIQALSQQNYSLRKIAAVIGCAHTTIMYELRRGTPEAKSNRGRKHQYAAKRGQKAYNEHRKNSRRPYKIDREDCEPFIQWMAEKIRKQHWSIDVCVGYAKLHKLFALGQIPCTKTLYNMLWQGKLPITLTLFEVPKVLGRKRHRKWVRKNKRIKGRSIEERPAIVVERKEFGHWEVDTVVGRRKGREAVIFTAVEKLTSTCIAIRISNRTSAGVESAMIQLADWYGEKQFCEIFKTMTADNGSEFETFSKFESLGTKIYFAHPYSSWERPQNERQNGMIRDYIPKGTSIERFSDDDILNIADELNQRPRRSLSYHAPIEIFEDILDGIYAIRKNLIRSVQFELAIYDRIL